MGRTILNYLIVWLPGDNGDMEQGAVMMLHIDTQPKTAFAILIYSDVSLGNYLIFREWPQTKHAVH